MKKPLQLGASRQLTFSKDGSRLAVLAGGLSRKLSVWDVDAGKRLYTVRPLSYLSRMEFSPCGDLLALKNTLGHIAIVDAASGETRCDFDNAGEAGVSDGTHPLFSGCGKFLIDGTGCELRVHEVASGAVVFEKSFVAAGESVDSIVRRRGGATWLFAHVAEYNAEKPDDEGEDYITEWSWPFERATPRRLPLADTCGLRDIATTDRGRYLALRVWDQVDLHIYSLEYFEHVFEVSTSASAHLRWSPDGRYLAIVDGKGIVVYDAAGFGIVAHRPFKDLDDMAFSPRGDCIALGAGKGCVAPWADALDWIGGGSAIPEM